MCLSLENGPHATCMIVIEEETGLSVSVEMDSSTSRTYTLKHWVVHELSDHLGGSCHEEQFYNAETRWF